MELSRWAVQLTADVDNSVSIQQKHALIAVALLKHEKPWGLKGQSAPPTQSTDPFLVEYASLTRLLRTPVRYADLQYRYRPQKANYRPQDVMNIEFNSARVSTAEYKRLVHKVLPDYIIGFNADSLRMHCLQPYLTYVCGDGYEPSITKSVAIRSRPLPCITAVNFWSDALCHRAFNRDAQTIAGTLAHQGIDVRWIHGGIYVVFSDELLPAKSTLNFEQAFRPLLTAPDF